MRSVVTVKLVNGLAAQICSVGGAARVGAIRVSTPMRTWKKGTAVASTSTLDNVINLCKRRGFVFPCGEIYGGTRAAWDYGPFGVELKENIKRQWWRAMVTRRDDVVGLDSSVILPREVWVASGHVGVFNDPLTECLSCHKRMRADHLQEGHAAKHGIADPDSISLEEVNCPNCGNKGQWTEPRDFNMMLKTYLGPVEDKSGLHYLRPETAQGIFVNFQNVLTSARKKPPFGIAQTGKSFVSSSRWRWSSSSNPEPTRSGISTGSTFAPRGTPISASTRITCATTSILKKSSPTTRSALSTLSTSLGFPGLTGVSLKVLLTVLISIWVTIPGTLVRICRTTTRPTTSATCLMLLSRRQD